MTTVWVHRRRGGVMEYIRSIRMTIVVDTNKQTHKMDEEFETLEDMVEAAETFADEVSRP